MSDSLKKIYEEHHKNNRPQGFTLMEDERGAYFSASVGKGKKVLDLGCRDGALTKYFVPDNEVLGADIDSISLERAKEKIGIKGLLMDLNGDWTELKEEKFDVVTAGEVIEHLYYPEETIKKISARLKEGGIFVGSVPNAFSLKNRLRYLKGSKKFTPLADPTHINHFSYSELAEILKRNFKEVEIIGLGKFKRLSRLCPRQFAFILVFRCRK